MSFRVNFQVNDIVRKLTESFTFNLYKKSVKKKNTYHHTIFLGIGQIGTGCTVFILVSWTFDRKIIGLLHYNCLWSCDFYLRAFSKWCLSCLTEKKLYCSKKFAPTGIFQQACPNQLWTYLLGERTEIIMI